MKTRTIDTNILVRLFSRDDDAQWATAVKLVSAGKLVVLSTVLMETEWVLRSRYGFDRQRITELFLAMLNSPSFLFKERDQIMRGMDAFSNGMDFADAMHVCLTNAGETFMTFDRDLVRLAGKHIDTVSVELAS